MARSVREIGERRLYAIVAIAALLLLFLVAFIVKNSRDVRVSFVAFDATAPLIAVMLACTLIGLALGIALMVLVQHARARSGRLDDEAGSALSAPHRSA